MSTDLYFLSSGKVHQLIEHKYNKEENLQDLIANNPQLILREKESGNKLMLVAREYEVSGEADGSSTYYLDHLFVGTDAVPVLVEVKRSSDTRIRREVVGQMMDYVSGIRFWDVSNLRQLFVENNSEDPDAISSYDNDEFWQKVSVNLKAEHIRMVFAADSIPDSLRSIIEFMDRNMEGIEIYGVEVHQYLTDGAQMLTSSVTNVPPVDPKSSLPGIDWDITKFSECLQNNGLGSLFPVVEDILGFSDEIGLESKFGRGAKLPTIAVRNGQDRIFCIAPWKYADGFKCPLQIELSEIVKAVNGIWSEEEIRSMLSNIPDEASARKDKLIWDTNLYIYIDMELFKDERNLSAFKETLRRIRSAIY